MQCLPIYVAIKFIQLSGFEIPFLLLKRTHGDCFLFSLILPQATLERGKASRDLVQLYMLQLYDFPQVLRLAPKR